MIEEEYFEKFKSLGMYLAYANMVDTIEELKSLYYDEANQGIRSWKETQQIFNALDIVKGGAKIKRKKYLEKC